MATVVLSFTVCCLAAHFGFAQDIFSASVALPLIVIRAVQLAIVSGLLIAARAVGRRISRRLAVTHEGHALEVFLTTATGLAAFAIFAHLASAFHALRFVWVFPPIAVGVADGARFFRDDLRRARARAFANPVTVAVFLALLAPIALRASLPFFNSDELSMYLPQLRAYAAQGSFAPIPSVQMLSTFTSAGLSLLTVAYVLGGDGAAIYLSFATICLTALGIYGVLQTLARSPLALFGPALFLVLAQTVITEAPTSPGFVGGGMGFAKLHAITTLFVLAEIACFLAYRRAPSAGHGRLLALLASTAAGTQIFGLATLVVLTLGLLVSRGGGLVIAASWAMTTIWYLKPWMQVGCPFPTVIAPSALTDPFMHVAKFYPRFYNWHYRHLVEGQDAMGGIRRPFDTVPRLLRSAPFALVAIALPFTACRLAAFSKAEAAFLRAALLAILVIIFAKVPNTRYFLYFFPVFSIVLLAALGSLGPRPLVIAALCVAIAVTQATAEPTSRVWLFNGGGHLYDNLKSVFVGPLSQSQQVLASWFVPRLGSTPFWARRELPADAKILHSNLDQWYFARRETYQMNGTLGAASFQPKIENVVNELASAGITHFFFSFQPYLSSPDQARLYTPLYDRNNFRRYFELIHSAEDGLLFRFHPEGIAQLDPEYRLPIRPENLDVRVWR